MFLVVIQLGAVMAVVVLDFKKLWPFHKNDPSRESNWNYISTDERVGKLQKFADKYINMLEYKAYDYSGGKPVQVDMPNMGARLEGLRTAIYEAVAETSDKLFEKYFSGEEFTLKRLSSVFPRVLKAAPSRPYSAATLCLCAAWSSLWTAFAGSPRARRIRARKSA